MNISVDNAIILTAGFGSRFVPFTYETPKGLLRVKGEPMVERQVRQLHEAGVTDITLVVGYLREKFEYLVDKYGVELVLNPEYAVKNNFVSVYYVRERLKNTYILVADNWFEDNIFNATESHSWIGVSYFEGPTDEWGVTMGEDGRIERIDTFGEDTWALNGPGFFTAEFSRRFAQFIEDAYEADGTDDWYWEHIIKENIAKENTPNLEIYANKFGADRVFEFENLEQLRIYDESYRNASGNAIMQEIAGEFGVAEGELVDIAPLKEGVSNDSFTFRVEGGTQRYVFRKPGIGTDKLINRRNEKKIYELLEPLGISDEVVYFDAESGNRITKFWDGVRVSDPFDDADLELSMRLVRSVHDKKIIVDNAFDMPKMIEYYKGLCAGVGAVRFDDFDSVLKDVGELIEFRKRLAVPEVLCNGDFLYANVLIFEGGGSRLIDWEFGGMADPIMDVAMYGIFSCFGRERLELSLRFYLGREPKREELARLYLYTALGGFLWMLWAEYKQALGQEFGDYPSTMYQYMKDYFRLLNEGGFLE